MKSLSMTEFPPPGSGKTGWPWVSASLPADQNPGADDRPWPKITIVTPNYNYGHFIEMTIRSVLLQGYPNLEYIIMDGGSSDQSVEIIKKYESWLTFWKSGPDRGQTHAINDGFRMATGEIINWLCSDDYLMPGALWRVGSYFREFPDIDVLVGKGHIIHVKYNHKLWVFNPRAIDILPVAVPFAQPSCFYRRRLLDRPAPLDESYDYVMDLELWTYFKSRGARWKVIDEVLSVAHYNHNNKGCTGGVKITHEMERIYTTYVKEKIPLTFWHRRLRFPLEKFMAKRRRPWLLLTGPVWIFWTLILGLVYGFKRAWYMRWKWVIESR